MPAKKGEKRYDKDGKEWYPNRDFTPEERKENARKAGLASVEAKRKRKELRLLTKDFLMAEANPALKQNMKMLGVDPDDMSNLLAMITRLFTSVVTKGDLNAARTLIEWAGMAPLQEERENEQIAKMAQAISLAAPQMSEDNKSDDDVVFYIPDNGREVIHADLVKVDEN